MFDGRKNIFRRNALVYVKGRLNTVDNTNAGLALLGDFVSATNFWHINDVEVSYNVG